MIRILTIFAVSLTALAAPLHAVPEEAEPMITGEVGESVDLSPETIIPWHGSLLELPQWMSREAAEMDYRIRPANQGAGLFPAEVWPLQPEPVLGPLIWDDALAGNPSPPRLRNNTAAPVALGPEIMALYMAQPPNGVFVDPQHLAPGGELESLVQRWLNDQCVFRTTVLLFGEGQQFPADFDPQALRRQWFGENAEALLVFYFQHEPERTLAIFGPEARTRYGADVLRSVVDAAVIEAGRVSGGTEQLERFCYKMSVRLHWLARANPPGSGANLPGDAPEVASGGWRKAGAAVLAAAGLTAGAWWLFLTWQRRRRAAHAEVPAPVFLPEVEFEPRLGAPHSGGFSSMITFAKTTAPPTG
jgi:hypothetical protein